jgi:hypothetical protein
MIFKEKQMSGCNKYNFLFEKAVNGELNDSEEKIFKEHLNTCGKCSSEYGGLKNTLTLLQSNVSREVSEEFLNDFWETLEPKLEKKQSPLGIIWDKLKNYFYLGWEWKYQFAGAAALIVIGIFIGRYLIGEKEIANQPAIYPNNSVVVNTSVNVEAEEYIERSKVLFLGLMNFDPATDDVEAINLSHQKKISRDLLTKASDLKSELKGAEKQQLRKLVSDIELILLQVANLETKNDLEGIELIKDGVNHRGILLKINIEEIKESSGKIIPGKHQIKKESKRI